MQLRPHPRYLPDRGPGILQQSSQLRGEKHDPASCVRHQAGEGGLGIKCQMTVCMELIQMDIFSILYFDKI